MKFFAPVVLSSALIFNPLSLDSDQEFEVDQEFEDGQEFEVDQEFEDGQELEVDQEINLEEENQVEKEDSVGDLAEDDLQENLEPSEESEEVSGNHEEVTEDGFYLNESISKEGEKLTFYLDTNIPDSIGIWISVYDKTNDLYVEEELKLEDGLAKAELNLEGFSESSILTIDAPEAKIQSKEVKEKLGYNYEFLDDKYIYENSQGVRLINYKVSLN